jgi:hypothetical protein
MVPAVLTQTPASALPYDNTRWCAVYDRMGEHELRLFHLAAMHGDGQWHRRFLPAQSILQSGAHASQEAATELLTKLCFKRFNDLRISEAPPNIIATT